MLDQPEKKYYVYELSYPESMGDAVFYVGKGSSRKTWKGEVDRIDEHEKQAMQPDKVKRWGRNVEKCQVIQSIWANGEQVVKRKVFWTDIEQEAYAYESKLIEKYGIENLTNKPRGGRPRSDRLVTVGSLRSKPVDPPVEKPKKQVEDYPMSVQDVADFLDVRPSTIIGLINRGELKSSFIDGACIISRSDVMEFIDIQTTKLRIEYQQKRERKLYEKSNIASRSC